jgi:hypothetical protein
MPEGIIDGHRVSYRATTMVRVGVSLLLAVTLLPGLAAARQRPVELKVGDTAPAFTLPGTDGRTYRLADYRG